MRDARRGERDFQKRGCKRTDEVGVIRRQFVVQLHGVRLVDGVPERGPASNNRVDVFRAGGSEKNKKNKKQEPPHHEGKGGPHARQLLACWWGGGGRRGTFSGIRETKGRTCVSQSAGQPSHPLRARP